MKIKSFLRVLLLALSFMNSIQAQTNNPLTFDVNDIELSRIDQLIGQKAFVDGITVVRSGRYSQLTPEKIQLLAQEFPNIIYLNLRDTGLNGESIAALQPLLSGAMFSKLQYLDLSQNPLDSSDISLLKSLEMPLNLKLPPIQSLNIAALDIPMVLSPETFKSIKELGYFKQKALELSLGVYFRNVNLRNLDVSQNPRLGDLPIYALIDSTIAQSLERLNIAYTNPTVEGLEKLATSASFKRLRSLNLAGSYNLGIAQLTKLAAGLGSQLEELIITDTPAASQPESNIRKIFPKLKKLNF